MITVPFKRTNHVISIRFRGRKSLDDLFRCVLAGKYCPKKFSAITLKVCNPPATVILFSTGTASCMGIRSYYGALLVLHYIKKKLGLELIHIMLTNIVSNFSVADLFPSLDIDRFQMCNMRFCSYNPAVFPSCSYKRDNKNIKINIFSSGRIIVVGTKTDQDIHETIEFICQEFAKLFTIKGA